MATVIEVGDYGTGKLHIPDYVQGRSLCGQMPVSNIAKRCVVPAEHPHIRQTCYWLVWGTSEDS